MSATIDAAKFANYFQVFARVDAISAPVIKAECQRQFAIKIWYLDDLGLELVSIFFALIISFSILSSIFYTLSPQTLSISRTPRSARKSWILL
jgi:hypothetical protein